MEKPNKKPNNPNFSSGPCAKRPGWKIENLINANTGRSHRSGEAKLKLKLVIDKSKELLNLPDDYVVGIMPGSDTGALEASIWSLIGDRGVDILAWENFGKDWIQDVVKQLKISNLNVHDVNYGQFPDITKTVGVNPMQGSAYPKVNVYEYDDKIGIVAEIPGLNKKQLDVSVEEGILTISGDKHSSFDAKDAKVIRRELKQSSFKRQFELGELLDGEKIKASFKDGLLSIDVPKVEPTKPKKLSVKIG